MSAASAASPAAPVPVSEAGGSPASEPCPLCGTPLQRNQDWCLGCGAAARTRLASPPRWRPAIVVLAAVVCVSLGVLAAALVALAGGDTPAPVSTRIVTAAAAPAATQPSAGVGGVSAGASGAASSGATSPTSTAGGSAASRAGSSNRAKAHEGVGGKGAGGALTTPKVKLPASKIPSIKIPKIKIPPIKLPKLSLPASER